MVMIAGVDCGGSKVAVAILTDSVLAVHRYVGTSRNRRFVLGELARFAASHLRFADVVWVEEPLVGRGVQASLKVAQAAGAVMSHLVVPAYFVPVGSWKKVVIGSGNAPKELVRSTLMELQPGYSELCDGDQDLIDATCIALYGQSRQSVVERLTADHQL